MKRALYQIEVVGKGQKFIFSFDNRAAAWDFCHDARRLPDVASSQFLNYEHGQKLYTNARAALSDLNL